MFGEQRAENVVYTKTRVPALILGCTIAAGCATNQKAEPIAEKRVYFSHSYTVAFNSTQQSKPGNDSNDNKMFNQTLTRSGSEVVIFFDNDSYELRQGDVEHLQSYLMGFEPRDYPIFMITGHTDNNHSDLYNLKLSERRAKRTQQIMLTMGVPEVLTTLRAAGEHSPAATNETAAGRQSNRRVTVQAVR